MRLETLTEMIRELNVTNSQLVVAWLLHHQPRAIPIVAASSLKQLAGNLQALSVPLTSEHRSLLDQAGG